MEAFVKTEKRSRHAVISFFHPMSNSLPGTLLDGLRKAILEVGADEDVSVILIRSEGDRAFCGGASFEELVAVSNADEGKFFFSGFAGVINAIRTCGKVVIGRVQGKAVGGGVGLASAFDICYATKHASIRLSELAVGIGPFVIGPAVSRKIGMSAFAYMSLTPDQWQSADWAMEKGLYHQVFESTDAMDASIELLVQKLIQYNPEALSQLKKVFWEGTDDWDELLQSRASISGQLVLSDYSKEAIKKIKSK